MLTVSQVLLLNFYLPCQDQLPCAITVADILADCPHKQQKPSVLPQKAREMSLCPEVFEKANRFKGSYEGETAPHLPDPHPLPWALHLDNNSSCLQKPFPQVSAEWQDYTTGWQLA